MSLFGTKEEYDSMVKNMEQKGYRVLTKYRKGIKSVRVADIPLGAPHEALSSRGALGVGADTMPNPTAVSEPSE